MNIQYFGEIAERTKCATEEVNFKTLKLESVLSYLKETYNISLEDIHIAINHELVGINDDIELIDTDEVAILSPFAGG